MSRVVIDASALLALVNGEEGAERVAKALDDASISAVNLSESVAKLADAGLPEEAIRQALEPFGLEVTEFDEQLAWQADLLRFSTKRTGLSFGDRACLALAQKLGVAAVTADRDWRRLDVGVEVQLIR